MTALVINCSPVRTGATAYIAELIEHCLHDHFSTKMVCIDDYHFGFCMGCRSCHTTAECVIDDDDITLLMEEYKQADVIVCISSSYWADIPGQFKAFIDRCTPWCNTHEPHASIGAGKKGYAIALRTGPSMRECNRVIESIQHFHGHLEIESCGNLGLCGVENRAEAETRKDEIKCFCEQIILNA